MDREVAPEVPEPRSRHALRILLGLALLRLCAGCAPRAAIETPDPPRTALLSERLFPGPGPGPGPGDPLGRGAGERARLYRLRNGVRVLLQPDRRQDVVALHSCVAVGQWHEGRDHYGLAHLVEHLVYDQMDAAYGLGDRVEGLAGSTNAFTSLDQTCYHINVPSQELDWVLALDSARLKELRVEADRLETHRHVVLAQEEEARENSWRELYRRVHGLLYDADPYKDQLPRWQDHLRAVTLDDVRGFFARYYRPSRMLVTLVGGFSEAEALQRIEASYGSIEERGAGGERVEPVFRAERRTEERRLTFKGAGLRGEHVLIGYRAPAASDPAAPAMEVLAEVLEERLADRLMPVQGPQLAERVLVSMNAGRRFGLFLIDVELDEGEAPAIEAAVDEELGRLRRGAPDRAELERARLLLQRWSYQRLQGSLWRAFVLAEAEQVWGGYGMALDRPGVYARISGRQVRQLARRYLGVPGRTVIFAGEPEEPEEDE